MRYIKISMANNKYGRAQKKNAFELLSCWLDWNERQQERLINCLTTVYLNCIT